MNEAANFRKLLCSFFFSIFFIRFSARFRSIFLLSEMSTLTDADRARIAQNRARALQLSAERKAREAAAEEAARTQASDVNREEYFLILISLLSSISPNRKTCGIKFVY